MHIPNKNNNNTIIYSYQNSKAFGEKMLSTTSSDSINESDNLGISSRRIVWSSSMKITYDLLCRR